MSEKYYRYNSDDAPINLLDDQVYQYVLEREQLKELDLVGSKCSRTMEKKPSAIPPLITIAQREPFGNLNSGNSSLLKNLLVIILVIVVLYFIYSLCEDKKNNSQTSIFSQKLSPSVYYAQLSN